MIRNNLALTLCCPPARLPSLPIGSVAYDALKFPLPMVMTVAIVGASLLMPKPTQAKASSQRCELLFIDESSRAELQKVAIELAQLQIKVVSTDQNLPSYTALNADVMVRRHELFHTARRVGLSRKLMRELISDAL